MQNKNECIFLLQYHIFYSPLSGYPFNSECLFGYPLRRNVTDESAILYKSFHHLFISMRETVTSLSAQHNQIARWLFGGSERVVVN